MRSLLGDARELRRILLRPGRLPNEEDVERLQELLSDMEGAVDRLERAGGAARHPLLETNLSEFRLDVRYAQASLTKDPPDFLQVAVVPGACVYCHSAPPR